MEFKNKNTDPLHELFTALPEKELPASFCLNTMQAIQKEALRIKRHSERLALLVVISAVVTFLALGVVALQRVGFTFPVFSPSGLSSLKFYAYIGSLSLFLLFFDYKLRKHFKHKR